MKPKEQRMTDIEAQYPDQWVLAEVTREDRFRRASNGIVLSHGTDADKCGLVQEARKFRASHAQAQTFLFWTGRLIPEGVGVML